MATPYYGWVLPVVGASADAWGGLLNAVVTAQDTQLASPAGTIKGNNTGSTAASINLTPAQVSAMLPAVAGDVGAGGAKGLVPAPAPGDAAAGKVLGAGGAWVPAPGYVKAVGQFSGATGATVFASGLSASRTGVGIYSITISPPMPDANYAVFAASESNSTSFAPTISSKTASGFSVFVARFLPPPGASELFDPLFLNVSIQTA